MVSYLVLSSHYFARTQAHIHIHTPAFPVLTHLIEFAPLLDCSLQKCDDSLGRGLIADGTGGHIDHQSVANACVSEIECTCMGVLVFVCECAHV